MTLKPFYALAALLVALAAAAAIVEPALPLALADPDSARANADLIAVSFTLFALWFLAAVAVLARVCPSAADWPSPGPLWPYAAWFALCGLYTAFEHGWIAFPRYMYEEDGILETATAVLLLVAAIGFAESALRAARTRRTAAAGALVTMAVLCFVFMMEELSWGQRIFGWATPEGIERVNVQNETNIHNMFQGSNQLIRLVVALIGASILLSSEFWRARLGSTGLAALVPARRHVYFVPFLIYAHLYDEMFEEVMALFLIVYLIDVRRALRA